MRLNAGQAAALYAASRSSIRKFKTGAAVMHKGEVLEIGWSHVSGILYDTTPYSIHAEHHCISRLRDIPEGAEIYIATLSRKGNITTSAPCPSCQNIINKKRILRAHFTIPGGEWAVWSGAF